ncbi:MAG: hypothetical protein DBY32_02125 [Phascolarctobacterium sp.]|nr:MAG: hypothetical protein DBY32_02125 [Phascolarctobacterium sp.]
MLAKLIRIVGYIGYGLFFALFGGYPLAAIIYLILTWFLQPIGFNITSNDIISSIFGLIILLVCMAFTGLIGVGFGIFFTAWLNKLFSGGK